MKIQLIVDAEGQFSWHSHLATTLREAGHRVVVQRLAGGPDWPISIRLLLEFETLAGRNRRRRENFFSAEPIATPENAPPDAFDLAFDLSAGARSGNRNALRLLYDGVPDPAAALGALLDRHSPRLDLIAHDELIGSAWPANEEPGSLSAGLGTVFARAIDLCLREVTRRERGLAPLPPEGSRAGALMPKPIGAAAARFGMATIAAKARARLTRLVTQPRSWRIGMRRLDGAGLLDGGTVPEDAYAWLADDGRRFYADPFLIRHEGRTWLFCEEFPYATATGIISVCEIGPDGRPGPTRAVLETGSHLSYPYVFAEDGEIWMIPESSAAGDVVLYRAAAFPWRWEPVRKLLDGIEASDATPIRHDGRLWLFASLGGAPGASSWDALGLFHAPDLFGEFEPHPLNPVLIDAGSARPAGRMLHRGGRLLRIAQDCRAGYGAGVAVATVDRLDAATYAQSVTRRITAPAVWNAAGLHAIEIGGGYEAIDIYSARAPG